MARSLFSTVKGVLKISLIAIAAFSGFHAGAQSLLATPVTYSSKSVKLDKVIDDLSRMTGIYFVYSSNKIVANQPVSLTVTGQPLLEVLDLIGKQLNLSFKSEGRHVVIKSLPPVSKPVAHTSKLRSDDIILATTAEQYVVPQRKYEIPPQIQPAVPATSNLSSPNEYLQKSIIRLQSYFDSTTLSNVPVQYVRRINRHFLNRGWFISVGPVFNDYSSGFELQAGLPHMFAIYAPTWISMEKFHGAYGIGSSVQISEKFSFNPSYLFARVKESETFNYYGVPPFREDVTMDHHQVKFMLQYNHVKVISLRAGVTLNASKSTYDYQIAEKVFFISRGMRLTDIGLPGKTVEYNPVNVGTSIPSREASRLWIGWEVSLSYRINFLKK